MLSYLSFNAALFAGEMKDKVVVLAKQIKYLTDYRV